MPDLHTHLEQPGSFVLLGVSSICVALVLTFTGKAWDRFRGLVDRAEDPKLYWWQIAVLYLAGVVSFGIFLLS
jgi:hypothetical protein